jgi:hypothetical protein
MPPAKATAALRNTDVRTWDIPGIGAVTQKPLTFFEKNEFLGLAARALDQTLSKGMDLDGIMQALSFDDEAVAAVRSGQASIKSMPKVDELLGAVTRLFSAVPELLEEAYLIMLGFPPENRDRVRAFLRQIDDDTGFGIFEAFVEQNASTLVDFGKRWWAQLTTAQQRLAPTDGSSETSSD